MHTANVNSLQISVDLLKLAIMPPTQSRFKGLNARNKHSYTFLFQIINLLAFNKCASSQFLFKGHYREHKRLAERTIKDHRSSNTGYGGEASLARGNLRKSKFYVEY